jgi:ABC-type amino acid transport substrate-binding protein
MKKIGFIFTVVALMLAGCGCDKEAPKQSNHLVVGLSADYPPFEYFKEGQIVGFDVDLMKALAAKIGATVEFKDMNLDGIIGALQTNRIEAAISSLTVSEERKKAVDFTDSYYSGSVAIVSYKTLKIDTLNDIKGQTIGVQTGSVYETYANSDLKAQVGDLTIKTLPKIPDLIQDLKSKRIVCLVMGTTEAKRLEAEQPDLKAMVVGGSETEVAIAVPKNSELRKKLNQALAEMKADGSLERLTKEWLK